MSSPSTPGRPGSAPAPSPSAPEPASPRIVSSPSTSRSPGWVEHDATEIWTAVRATLTEVLDDVGAASVAAVGITNQRETVVAWDRTTGEPYGRAIVWQDRRTADRCRRSPRPATSTSSAGAPGSCSIPTSAATKYEWLLDRGRRAGRRTPRPRHDRLVDPVEPDRRGTPRHRRLQRQPHDAVRHQHAALGRGAVRPAARPARRAARGGAVLGPDRHDLGALRRSPPASRSAASPATSRRPCSGSRASQPGMAKNTYGTGSFVLLNVGAICPPPADGLLTTVAWTLADGTTAYALEGAIFVHRLGRAVAARRSRSVRARRRDRSAGRERRRQRRRLRRPGVHRARLAVVGSLRPRHRGRHHARDHQGAPRPRRGRGDGVPDPRRHRGDGARRRHTDHRAARRRRRQRDGRDAAVPGRPARRCVSRPVDQETTALGAAFLAGLAEGAFPDLEAVARRWTLDATFTPGGDRQTLDAGYGTWLRAVERSRGFASPNASQPPR